jgi:hypothetical protein
MGKRIPELPAASAFDGTEYIEVAQAGQSRYGLISAIVTYLGSAFEAIGAVAAGIAAHLAVYAHGDIDHANRTELDLVSGTNTGDQDLSAYAPLADPVFTGAPTCPTASLNAYELEMANAALVVGKITYMINRFMMRVTSTGAYAEGKLWTPFVYGAITKPSTGVYEIALSVSDGNTHYLNQCHASVQLEYPYVGFASIEQTSDGLGRATIRVRTYNTSGALSDAGFYIGGWGTMSVQY